MPFSPKVAIFWTAKKAKFDWPAFVWDELRQGRLRQGWAPPGSALTAAGKPRSLSEWSRHYIAAARNAWPWCDGDKELERNVIQTRFEILARMLDLEAGDVLVVPRMPSEGEFAVVTVTEGYGWEDLHYREGHRDLGHVVYVDPRSVRRWEYNVRPEAKRIVAKFSNYRSAVTFVANPKYRADVLKLSA